MVTIASEVEPKESVTRTVVVPAAPGAVKTPVVESIEPLPRKIEYVYGDVPPVAVKVFEFKAAIVADVGAICNCAGELETAGLGANPLSAPLQECNNSAKRESIINLKS